MKSYNKNIGLHLKILLNTLWKSLFGLAKLDCRLKDRFTPFLVFLLFPYLSNTLYKGSGIVYKYVIISE